MAWVVRLPIPSLILFRLHQAAANAMGKKKMPGAYDAYHKWLGIPPKEQPANQYRLLGAPLLEDDPDVIANAADQRMSHVRSFQAGQHSAISQRILGEIAAARICLLNAEKKAAYDAMLREQLAPSAPPVVQFRTPERQEEPFAGFDVTAVTHHYVPTAAVERKPRLKSISSAKMPWQLPATIGAGLLACVAIWIVLAVTKDGSQEAAIESKAPESPPPSVKSARPAPVPTTLPKKELAVDLGNGIKLEMVLIPAGEFMMGSPDSDKDAGGEEKPRHRVQITKPFYLGKYLVTQEQWEAVMGNNPSHFKGPKNPVEQVSWDDCQQFLGKLNERFRGPHPSPLPAGEGTFQLPSEAQWECACRAGSTTRFCFGDDESGLGDYGWYGANSGQTTRGVGEKKPNAWGLYDMHGNVWEWCQDWYDGGYYANSPADDPTGPATGTIRVIRGGHWNYGAGICRSAIRKGCGPGDRYDGLGFRVSLVPADK